MKFKRIENISDAINEGVVYLIYGDWDDYGYCTSFEAYYRSDINGNLKKIGCESLSSNGERDESINGYASYSVKNLISTELFDRLPNNFFFFRSRY